MNILGEMTLAGHRFLIHHATFRRIVDDGQGNAGWEFDICTQPPVDTPADEAERYLFANGVRFYSEGDPIPLQDREDLTGVELYIEEPFDPDSGEVHFTVYVGEHQDVSHARLRFLERRDSQYHLQASALVHHIFEQPAELAFECWITRQPSARYGADA